MYNSILDYIKNEEKVTLSTKRAVSSEGRPCSRLRRLQKRIVFVKLLFLKNR